MKKNFISLVIILASTLTACDDWLTAPQPGVTMIEDFYSSGDAAIQNITACYVPLQWEYSNTYCCEWFIGDVVSDDALKGGQSTNDMSDVYDMENWKTATNNTLLHDFYKAQYQGIARCNMALENIPNMDLDSVMTQSVKNRLIGEAKFLRAYYYFRLVRVFGGVPKVDHVINSDAEWQQARASVAEIYDFILSDLEDAQKYLWKKSEYADEDMGRATKGAAQAMLMKANLYFAGDGNTKYRNGADAADIAVNVLVHLNGKRRHIHDGFFTATGLYKAAQVNITAHDEFVGRRFAGDFIGCILCCKRFEVRAERLRHALAVESNALKLFGDCPVASVVGVVGARYAHEQCRKRHKGNESVSHFL